MTDNNALQGFVTELDQIAEERGEVKALWGMALVLVIQIMR